MSTNMSTFGTFTLARLGIYVSQQALTVTGNNITNINTEGYTRQSMKQTNLSFGGADRYQGRTTSRMSGGVIADGTTQLRDPYLDIRYRNEMTSVGEMDAKLSGLRELAGIFDEVGGGLDGEGVLEARFNELLEQIERLNTENAGKDDIDTIVRSSASALVRTMNDYAKRLDGLADSTATGFQDNIDYVNSILTRIRDLSSAIRKSQVYGGEALTQEDERNVLIDELSKYIGIDVTYETERLAEGVEVDRLVIKTKGDDPVDLINGAYGGQLSIQQVYTASGSYEDADGNIHNYTAGEPIAHEDLEWAKEEGLNANSPNYNLVVSELRNNKDRVWVGSEPHTFNDTELSGSLQAIRELLTESGEYTTSNQLDENDMRYDPTAATKRGIPYYQKALDLLASTFAKALNDANTMQDSEIYRMNGDVFVDADGNTVAVPVPKEGFEDYFVKDSSGAYAVDTETGRLTVKEGYEKYFGGPLFSNSGTGADPEGITARNISIAKTWADGEIRVLQSKEPNYLSRDNSNIVHMISLLTNDQVFTPDGMTLPVFKGTFQEMFTNNIAGVLADDTNVTGTLLDNHNTTADDLYVERDGVMGVDLNDEAMNLMQFQKAYSAACRLMTTFDQMLERLIDGTAV